MWVGLYKWTSLGLFYRKFCCTMREARQGRQLPRCRQGRGERRPGKLGGHPHLRCHFLPRLQQAKAVPD